MSTLRIATQPDPLFQMAAGEGEAADDFQVRITQGHVCAHRTYYIHAALSQHWILCTCTIGSTTGGTATFKKVSDAVISVSSAGMFDPARLRRVTVAGAP